MKGYVIPGVEGIDLGKNNLAAIPAELFHNYPNLKYINLNRNQLLTLPEEVGNVKTLQIFSASNNALSSLQEGFGKLENLSYLNFAHNKLTTIQRSTLEKLTSLKADTTKVKFNDNPFKEEDKSKVLALFDDHLKILHAYSSQNKKSADNLGHFCNG